MLTDDEYKGLKEGQTVWVDSAKFGGTVRGTVGTYGHPKHWEVKIPIARDMAITWMASPRLFRALVSLTEPDKKKGE